MGNSKGIYILLACLGGFGPFVTDLYLSCLPEISRYFDAPVSMVQLSLTSCMIGIAAGQMLIGPLTDKYGRKRPLLLCLLLFILSSIGCVFSQNIGMFITFRLLQGLAGAGGLVFSKVYVTDVCQGEDMTRKFAMLNAIMAITPIVAPVLGSFIFSLTSWQGIFIFLALWGAVMLAASPIMKESLPSERRLRIPLWKTFMAFVPVLKNTCFVTYTVMQGLIFATMFTYISASPFLFQEYFGLTPIEYGIYFAINSVGVILGNALVMKYNSLTGFRIGIYTLFLSCLTIALTLMFNLAFIIMEIAMFSILTCVGYLMTCTTSYALGAVEDNKGTATALLGTIVFMFAGIITPLSGLGDMIYTFSIILMIMSLATLGLYIGTRNKFQVSL